ncbi:MAG: acetylxylan esterase [Christensenellaceae bacterium]|nr:acetylxylan esterase [Christensenellaceae bacterium]
MKSNSKPSKILCIGLILVLLFSIAAMYIQTDGGKVRVFEVNFPSSFGGNLSAFIYKPDTATIDTPAPCVITTCGAGNTKEMQDIVLVELSRRGYVAISFDIYHHGKSSGTHKDVSYTMSQQYLGHGMIDLVDYVYNKLDYVDNTKIGITGHSTGGRVTSYTLNEYGRYDKIKAGIEEGAHYFDELYEACHQTQVAAALIVANVPAYYIIEEFPNYIDIGLLQPYYDEGVKSQITRIDGFYSGDMTVSPEAKNFVNQGVPGTFKMDKTVDYDVDEGAASAAGNFTGFSGGTAGYPQVKISNWDNNERIELNTWYKNEETGGRRIVYNPKITHAEAHFAPVASEEIISFFEQSLGEPTEVSGYTSYMWKEVCNLGALIGLFTFLYGLIMVLLDTPRFAMLKGEAPARIAKPASTVDKLRILINILIIGIVGALTVEWAMDKGANFLSKLWSGKYVSWTGNGIGAWSAWMGIVTTVVFLINHFLFNKKNGATTESWGIKISGKKFLRTVELLVLFFSGFCLVVYGINFFFGTDFRFWIYAIRGVSRAEMMYLFYYFPIFFIYYAIHSWSVNASYRFENAGKWNILLCVVATILAPVLGFAIEYIGHIVYDVLPFPVMWVFFLWLINITVNLTLATLLSRKMFETTGNIWLGALINTTMATYLTIATSRMITFLT